MPAGREPAGRAAFARWLGPALLALAGLELLRASWPAPAQTDDAWISYRYARNLVDGLGLVYNEGERVEGMTNLLWTLLVAAGLAAGAEARAVGHALGVASGAATLLATAVLARSTSPRGVWWAVAPWLLLSSLPFLYWTTSGMETPLFAALVTGVLAAEARGRLVLAAGLAFLATATRPEGALVAGVVLGWRFCTDWRVRGFAAAAGAPLLYALLLLGLTGFRLAYYGSPVPNTFYAKVGGVPPERGLQYALGFAVGGAGLLLLPAAYAAWRERTWWPSAALLVVFTGYVVAVGGDAFPYARFFVPLLPALAALAVRGTALLAARDPGVGALAAAALGIFLVANAFGRYPWEVGPFAVLLAAGWALAASWLRGRPAPLPTALAVGLAALTAAGLVPTLGGSALEGKIGGQPHRELRAHSLARNHAYNESVEGLAARRAGVLAARHPGERPLVATGGIGAFGYLTGYPIVDLYGLVDPEIARSRSERPTLAAPGHIRSNADYVFARDPEYILVPRRGARMIVSPSVADLWAHPELDARYVWDQELVGYRRTAPTAAR